MTTPKNRQEGSAQQGASLRRKKSYVAPKFVAYGQLSEITRGGSPGTGDGSSGKKPKA
jgi:hypothetical protein